jgi:lipoprotein Spr
MIKPLIPALLIIAAFASCSTLKPIQSGKNQVATPVRSTSHTSSSTGSKGKDVKFLDNIAINNENPDATITGKGGSAAAETRTDNSGTTTGMSVEKASALQLKYAILLNTALLEFVDDWYGTRYRMGGTTKSGVDCSAFTQAIYLSAFAVSLPRTAREQYRASRIISATELKEGDLVFFNTTGGVSHVGIYLQNNKFVHASSKLGVTISDMFDPYYIKHYIGAGRIERTSKQDAVIE